MEKPNRSKDIVGPILSSDFLDRVVKGKSIALTLPDGQEVRGEVRRLERDSNGILFVEADIKEPTPGYCFLQRQTMEGVAGPMVGHVRFEGKDRAWKIEPTADLKSARFVDRILDEVMCVNYEKMPEVMEVGPGDVQEAPQTHPTDIPIPSYQTVIPLQSLPGAIGVLYLDFDGEEGPFLNWGSFTAAPSGASNAEVFEVWKMVCEDYQGFNLNVTTDRKVFDSAAPGRRQQIIITPTTTAAPGAGGVAYVGSYNWSSNVPCWSFYSTGKDAAEVIAHELGHTLGLSHDGRISPSEGYYAGQGSGVTGWAPIMGVGYYQNLSQWSKGEYLSANQTQDDLSIIANNNNNVGYRTDDSGDTLATARYLDILSGGSVSNEGIIERTGDVDAFRFRTSGGLATLNLNPVSLSPDLDIYAEIVNAATLSVVVSNNPDLAITASVSATLPAGEYLLRVRGTGRGDPLVDGYTNYGCLGTYFITGTVAGAVVADRFSIAENRSNGTVVGTVAARANHGASALSWAIASGNSNGAFAINSTTGAITVANSSALNYEALSTRWDDPADFELFVTITDAANPALNESIRTVVSLTNVNEAPVMTGGSVTVLEGGVGTYVATVAASDPDHFDFPTISIVGGDPDGIFAIDSVTGVIRIVAETHLSQSTDFNLSVRAVDQGSLATTITYTVHLTKYVPVYSTRGDGKTLATFSAAGSGTWTVPAGVTSVEVLVVGGGGGANYHGSGAGAGGLYSVGTYAPSGPSVAITVGSGGVGSYTSGANGGLSQFDSIIAYGGQGVSGAVPTDGINQVGQLAYHGGNQGGYSINGGVTVVPGNPGGGSFAAYTGQQDSGGGAGAAGTHNNGSAGGIGVQNNITGTNTYYAGGGGATVNGPGGLGGGGKGGQTLPSQDGTVNTGGGAGGGYLETARGASGGSGVVILAYNSVALTFTVSFNSNGGSAVLDQNVPSNGTATVPMPAPTKTGSIFSGWYSDIALTNVFNFSTPITANTTLYAKWVTHWVVTFNSNGGSAVSDQNVPPNGTATVPAPAPTKTGSIFVGWYSDSALTTAFNFGTPITANTTLYAKWVPSYTVTFNSNGGTAVASQSVPSGSTATVPTPPPTRTGYAFSGWYSDSALTTAFNFSTPITASRTLYAKWITSYTVTFNSNGGTAVTAQSVPSGSTATVPMPPPTRTGYAFSGWYSNSALTAVFNFSTLITANRTLYAKWVVRYTVTFNSNGGTAVAAQSVPSGSTATVPTPPPTRTGYAFGGWYSNSTLTTVFNFSTLITANRTLYAKWVTSYTVTFNSNGGTAVAAQSVPSGSTATVPTPAPTRIGYAFGGWYSNSTLTTVFNFSTIITANRTLYAKWTINSYTLAYSAATNGTISGATPQTVTYGGSGTAVTANPDSGYRFVKWSDNSTSNPRADSNVTSNISVTASFELVPIDTISPTTLITRSDGKTVATFSTVDSGTWTIPAGVSSVEVLVVGGGGSGIYNGGGGGGGGFFQSNSYAVTSGRGVTVTVGAGAAGGASGGSAGNASVFDGLTAYGGMGGGASGGASGGNNQGGTVYAGGTEAGGGGGAGQAGANAWYTSAKGGDGLSSTIANGVTASWYAGGGSCRYNGADGGLGGGGSTKDANSAAINVPNGVNGLGGGGAGGRNSVLDAGAGGSGVVIVAYQSNPSAASIYRTNAVATHYSTWANRYSGSNLTDLDADLDKDGLTNRQEFAFGLDPTKGTSSSPVRHLGGAHFSYTRYAESLLVYTVWTSTNLKDWDPVDPDAMTTIQSKPNEKGVVTVEVTLKSPPVGGNLFLRVQAE